MVRTLKYNRKVNSYIEQNKLKKFILPSPTRWLYHFNTVQRFLEQVDYLPMMCSLANIDSLSLSMIEKLRDLQDILIVYKNKIILFESRSSKLSSVIPEILSLMLKLNSIQNPIDELAQELLKDFIAKTEFIFNIDNGKFNKIYSIATFLDPTTRKYLKIPDFSVSPIKLSALYNLVVDDLSKFNINQSQSPEVKMQKYSELDVFLVESEPSDNEVQRY